MWINKLPKPETAETKLGTPIILLYCDHHIVKKDLHGYFYKNLLQLADYIIYPSKYLQREGDKAASKLLLKSFLISDPWQINTLHRPRLKRKNESWKLIWFGSNSNLQYLLHTLKEISDFGFSIKHFRNYSEKCLAGEDLNFIKKFNSTPGKTIFKPVEASEIFSKEDFVD
mgnify:CR=1 FL=1